MNLILWILAAICFLLAACGVTAGRANLIAVGLFLVTLVWLIPEAGRFT